MLLSISPPIRYHGEGEKRPKKHQLLVEFEDGTAISSGTQMWGGFFCFPAGKKAAGLTMMWPRRGIQDHILPALAKRESKS